MEREESYQSLNRAKEIMSIVDTIIREMGYEAPGAKRVLLLEIEEGVFTISGKDNTFRYRIDTPAQIYEPGTVLEEGNIKIIAGTGVDAYEDDVDNNGTDDLVLENNAVLFAMKKLGNSSNNVFINTTEIVVLIKNKKFDVAVTPRTKLEIERQDNSSYGYGYTELISPGYHLSEGGIRLVMNSIAGINYDAIFTLGAEQDFVEVRVIIR